MKKLWKLMILTGLMLAIGLAINTVTAQKVSANSYTTAKSIRGNWYSWNTYVNAYSVIKVKKHSVVTYNQSTRGSISYYRVYTPHMTGSRKLSISIYKHAKKGSNNVYDLNRGYRLPAYKRIGFVWSSHKALYGHKYHVLKNYLLGGVFFVYFHHKIKHDYGYTHMKHWEYFLGR
ncbi:hypothetical protein [Lentilactobacillus kefiri]|uniref:Uncharacterized protein n=2 Tax=Lentilactobacillus kefiri TaxID=33962 RepID=A0A8E1V154_LENKE|nr:hypothetical protein [Lentilactobacillus kefiri]KRL62141.1 hypothetical protein FD08_GL002746 [Lentilactobacillus parakefiri DSM 10551]KRM50221.1 hypothetical protein FC95_GL002063 [Lentilactobacillus kefiri DSM 20587 = JCM 5818]MCJ2162431.1 hypothetical protein [Lentilactobacillus kefiri]MCP9369869.1 hypothetical protein [Lentilactobacillus kefiri]MDH5109661.1 hypothetical protein [Lentilactobacillus kefiri]